MCPRIKARASSKAPNSTGYLQKCWRGGYGKRLRTTSERYRPTNRDRAARSHYLDGMLRKANGQGIQVNGENAKMNTDPNTACSERQSHLIAAEIRKSSKRKARKVSKALLKTNRKGQDVAKAILILTILRQVQIRENPNTPGSGRGLK